LADHYHHVNSQILAANNKKKRRSGLSDNRVYKLIMSDVKKYAFIS
jgi:hypothetical protein